MTEKDPSVITRQLKQKALELGFDAIGIAPVQKMEEEYSRMKEWIKEGMHADMSYLEKAAEKRIHPENALEGARSVIVTLSNYFPPQVQAENTLQVSKYAYGTDYHIIIKKKLSDLEKHLHYIYGVLHSKGFVDSSPLFEKAWAQKAGLGWIGKNSLLNTTKGSFYFIGILVVDIKLEYNQTFKEDKCGNCTLCMDSCPTKAIYKPGFVDARRCISYQTVENKGILPVNSNKAFGKRIFGCDHCQDVCPWNKNASVCREKDFYPSVDLLGLKTEDWKNLDRARFEKIFGSSPVMRCGHERLIRNIDFVL